MNEFLRRILFLPEQRSTIAYDLDWLHYFVILTTMAGATLVTLVGAYFLFRYRRRLPEPDPPNPESRSKPSLVLEAGALAALAGLFLLWWFIGVRQFMKMRVAPEDATTIYVTAKKWMWKFAYPEGARSIGVLYVPAGRPVRLVMTSRDVIHSLFVPSFRLKHDVLPGRYTTLWFEVTEPGTYDIFCTEYCGTGHSTMRAEVVALSTADYGRWMAGATPREEIAGPVYDPPALGLPGAAAPREGLSMVRAGERAAAERGCLRCHSLDGTAHIGPTWAGLYRSVVPLQGGGSVVADEAYLTESMMDPRAKIHLGFAPIMPSYLGALDAPETAAIVELIKSLSRAEGRPAKAPEIPSLDGGNP